MAIRERELGRDVTLDDLAGFGWERPLYGVAMWAFVLSFAGLPFTGGFLGKFYVFAAAYEAGWWWIVLIAVVATAVSLYYYLGIVKAMYMRPGAAPGTAVAVAGGSPPRDAALGLGVAGALAVVVGSFFFVQPLVDLATEASESLPW